MWGEKKSNKRKSENYEESTNRKIPEKNLKKIRSTTTTTTTTEIWTKDISQEVREKICSVKLRVSWIVWWRIFPRNLNKFQNRDYFFLARERNKCGSFWFCKRVIIKSFYFSVRSFRALFLFGRFCWLLQKKKIAAITICIVSRRKWLLATFC